MLQRSTLVTELSGILPWPHGSTGAGACCPTQSRSTPELSGVPSVNWRNRTGSVLWMSINLAPSLERLDISTGSVELSKVGSLLRHELEYRQPTSLALTTFSHHPGELLLVSSGGLDFGLMRLKRNVSTPACLMQRVPTFASHSRSFRRVVSRSVPVTAGRRDVSGLTNS